tara:strand:+ start:69 stop:923 length:855 start_codon:yes stop_codon:yes gene_type:complete
MPKKDGEVLFYSNKFDKDFEYLIALSIRQAKKNISIFSYGFYNTPLIKLLEKRKEEGIDVNLFLDAKYAKPRDTTLNIICNPMRGLMHKKCIIIDDNLVFLGSTNITTTSLKLHKNLIIGIKNTNLAKCILHEKHYKDEKVELFCTGNKDQKLLELIISHINRANKSIHLAMFTFTHKKLLMSILKAHKRGVKLHIYLDKMQSAGCCKYVVKALNEQGVKIKYNNSLPLLHHKLCIIDDKQVITGSLNWTVAAFEKNKELVLILNDINQNQKKALHEILYLLDK